MDLSLLGSKIKAERKQQGLTLETLSERLGISRNFLWEIEAGRKAPALHTLYNLGLTLNVSIDYLMGISPERRKLNGEGQSTQRDLELSRIMKALNGYALDELSLVSDMIRDFSKYLEKK